MKNIKNRLWFEIFTRVAITFAVFVIVIAVANSTLLYRFFFSKQTRVLSEQMDIISGLNMSDENEVTEAITEISDRNRFDIEIYSKSGETLFTTYGGKMLNYLHHGNNLIMDHTPLEVITEREFDGGILRTATDKPRKTEYIVFTKELDSGNYAEIRIQNDLLKNSAETASEFVLIIAIICLAVSLVWIFIFARKFSKPISEMSEITGNMANLDFSRRIDVKGHDEIAELASSVNGMSDKLAATLENLNSINSHLLDEIEEERRLDVMRRGFVANVSHELKTPLSIIRGYAEGLKLNINETQKEKYCDTIIDESERMNKLVLSLLQLSKYESGQQSAIREGFNLAELIRETVPRIVGNHANLIIDLPDSIQVFADSSLTEQVIKSYTENAVAHVNSGGEISVSLIKSSEGKTRIGIYNTGSHIDEERMPLIWQSFYRGEESHKRDSSRFGLGLSIVSAITKLQGSKCGVFNTADGVCFWFEI